MIHASMAFLTRILLMILTRVVSEALLLLTGTVTATVVAEAWSTLFDGAVEMRNPCLKERFSPLNTLNSLFDF